MSVSAEVLPDVAMVEVDAYLLEAEVVKRDITFWCIAIAALRLASDSTRVEDCKNDVSFVLEVTP